MAQEKEERPGAAIKRSEAGEDSLRRTAAAQGRSREPANGELTASPPGRRRERYVIGSRAAPGGQPFAHPQFSMDQVVEYLAQQEDVEVVRRIKLGSTQPFTAGRSVSEVVVVKIEEAKAQRLQAAAPPRCARSEFSPSRTTRTSLTTRTRSVIDQLPEVSFIAPEYERCKV